MAKKLGLTYVSFWTEPATVLTPLYHMDLLVTNGHRTCPENLGDTITYIPGVPAIKPTDLASYLQFDIPPVVRQILSKAVEETKGADFLPCNTVEELELEAISALQREKTFYAVGPIFPADFARSTVAANLWTESNCSQWLDSKPAGSVLYISFGSYAKVSKGDLEEIAYGILDSKVNFIWAIRRDILSSDEPEPLPKEFLEGCHERGIVVPWCRQREVLSHPSIGGFLTHCGWNSVVESIWCAVPLLCFPLVSDQFTNRKLVVQDWKIVIEIGGLSSVSRNEVSKKIESLMGGEIGDQARKEIKELKKALETALSPNGSSQMNFDQLIEDLMKQSQKRLMK
ncbi:putative UDP-glycosyltransferase 86A1 [Cocos nucifera]|uniref:Putative UDP-glycosyltransferase 86A1 n=1 Tax=Cocos nucifera TaxID=13894 RepID=A0A8K0IF86_COCNU|nr:putative UDP-glycosyltransferase 86A1 [Cocos nucifera]